MTLICYTKIYTKNPFCNYSEHYFTHKTAPCATLFFVGFSLVFIGLNGRCAIGADGRYLGRCAMFPSTAGLWNWGDNAPQLLQAPPDPKHRTPPYSPLRGLTFVERAMFLTGSSKAFRLRCSTMLPNLIVRLLQLETKTGEQEPTSFIFIIKLDYCTTIFRTLPFLYRIRLIPSWGSSNGRPSRE